MMPAPGNNIRALRKQEGLTQAALGAVLGVTRRTVERWETGEASPTEKRIRMITACFGVSRDDILSESHGLAAKRLRHDSYRQGVAQNEADNTGIPLLKFAWRGDSFVLMRDKTVLPPIDVLKRHPRSFFIKPFDESMAQRYPPDSLLLVDTEPDPWNGATVIVIANGTEPLIRQYQGGNDSLLLTACPLRGSYPDIAISRRKARVLGVVVWYQASHDHLGF